MLKSLFQKSSLENYPPYLFSLQDSKFVEITRLTKENIDMRSRITQMKDHINKINEYDKIMAQKYKPNQIGEKRIKLLKAQIARQKNHIAILTNIAKLQKQFYLDLKNAFNFLNEIYQAFKSYKKEKLVYK